MKNYETEVQAFREAVPSNAEKFTRLYWIEATIRDGHKRLDALGETGKLHIRSLNREAQSAMLNRILKGEDQGVVYREDPTLRAIVDETDPLNDRLTVLAKEARGLHESLLNDYFPEDSTVTN